MKPTSPTYFGLPDSVAAFWVSKFPVLIAIHSRNVRRYSRIHCWLIDAPVHCLLVDSWKRNSHLHSVACFKSIMGKEVRV